MTQTPEDPGTAVRDLIDRLFDGVEPPHRPGMADTTIAFGAAAATRRRGFTVAGAAVGVLAVAAGAAVLGGARHPEGRADPGTGNRVLVAPNLYENSNPTFSDKIREIQVKFPGLVNPLLPAGMAVSHSWMDTGATSLATGDVSPDFDLRTAAGPARWQINADDIGYERFFAESPATTAVPVAGGALRVRTLHDGSGQYSTYAEYKPTDEIKPVIRFEIDGTGTAPLDTQDFVKMVDAPGFAAIAALLDFAAPASESAVLQRYQIEAAINAETAGLLPPGFLLKLAPTVPATLELVGPGGVNMLDWHTVTDVPSTCPSDELCYQGSSKSKPISLDDKARVGFYEYRLNGGTMYINLFGKAALSASHDPRALGKAELDTAPEGPGLSPRQVMAIMKTPNVGTIIEDVQKAVNP